MATLLVDCVVRSVLIAAGTVLVLWAMRIKSPAVRHAAWAAVVIAMLVLPIWLAGGPRVSLRILQPTPVAAGLAAAGPEAVLPEGAPWPARDTAAPAAPLEREVARPMEWQNILFGAYLLGVVVLLTRLLVGTIQANKLRRNAVMEVGRLTSRRCATPITVGSFRPALILPSGWQHWPAAKLAAVLTHEAEHARRRDPLVQWIALFNRAVFWCHPLSWWLERRLATLAEEACDAAVIAAGHSPQEYSGYLLDLARSMTREGRRLNVVGMAMPGSGLPQRMRQIFDGLPLTPVSPARVICTLVLCATSSVLFAAGTLAPRSGVSNTPQSSSAKPRFDVASIKRCAGEDESSGRGAGAGSEASPGRLQTACRTVLNLMQNAYIVFADGRLHPGWDANALPIEGGPAWIKSDLFQIEAKPDGPASPEMMRGPMMQSLLEDRFKLKLRRETRQVPVYEMVVASGGAKVKPFKLDEGTCTPFDLSSFPSKPIVPGRPACGSKATRVDGSIYRRDVEGISLDEFVVRFFLLDRPVVNRTGIPGLVVFSVQHDMSDPASVIPALKDQVGFELRPAVGPRDFLVVDHVEPPTPDTSVGVQTSTVAQAPVKPPTFDVASVKPCGPDAPPTGGRAGSAGNQASPGYLNLSCLTLKQFVNMAYNGPDSPLLNRHGGEDYVPDLPKGVRGGPSWAYSETYTIEAKADGVTDRNTLTGPMLRALLEDRFQLKTHRATEQQSMYTLTVAKSGLKIKPLAPGECWEFDPDKPASPHAKDVGLCGVVGGDGWGSVRAQGVMLGDVPERTGDRVVDMLWRFLQRVVIDRTGLNGRYSFAFDFTPDDTTPGVHGRGGPAPDPRPTTFKSSDTILQALEKLGLHLAQTKAPAEYLVIDHAERPTPDAPAPSRAAGAGKR